MEKSGIKGYEWNRNPNLASFKPIDYYIESPKLNDVVNNCENMKDFFEFFLNAEMVHYIVVHTNIKLEREKLKNKSNQCFKKNKFS